MKSESERIPPASTALARRTKPTDLIPRDRTAALRPSEKLTDRFITATQPMPATAQRKSGWMS